MVYYGPAAHEAYIAKLLNLTKDNMLYDRMSYAEVERLINQPNATVTHLDESTNLYGSFLFLDILVKPKKRTTDNPNQTGYVIQLYGMGYHDQRNSYQDWWAINDVRAESAYSSRSNHPSKEQALREINHARCQIEKDREWPAELLVGIPRKQVFSVTYLADESLDPDEIVLVPRQQGFVENCDAEKLHLVFRQPINIRLFVYRVDEGKTWRWVKPKRTSHQEKYDFLTHLTDEDAAYVMMEDGEFPFGDEE